MEAQGVSRLALYAAALAFNPDVDKAISVVKEVLVRHGNKLITDESSRIVLTEIKEGMEN